MPPSFGVSCRRAGKGAYVRMTSSSLICTRNPSTPLASSPRRSLRLFPERRRSFWPAHRPHVEFPACRHGRTNPRTARTSQPSPYYSLRLRSCKSMDAFVISSLPSRLKETLQTEGPFAPRPLLRFIAHTDPSATLSSSIDFPVEPVILHPAPVISRRDEEGFSSCLACPCHRAVASTPPRQRCRIGQISAPHAALP